MFGNADTCNKYAPLYIDQLFSKNRPFFSIYLNYNHRVSESLYKKFHMSSDDDRVVSMVKEAIETDIQHEYIGNTVGVHGPVVIIACNRLPPLHQALTAFINNERYLFEVHQHLDERHVRAITLHTSSGLRGVCRFMIPAHLSRYRLPPTVWAAY